jgi:hypothetical protein
MRQTTHVLVAFALLLPLAAAGVAVLQPLPAAAQQAPDLPDLDVQVETDGGGAWYTEPLWIAIGIIILLLIIVIIVSASRGGGGGTTVIRE